MANGFMTIDEVAADSNMTKEQIADAVKAGKLRQFVDQGVQKFRQKDVAEFKKRTQSDMTVLTGVGKEKVDEDSSHVDLGAVGTTSPDDSKEVTEFSMEVVEGERDTSRIDLADVDAEPGADESDQTSVLPVAEEDSSSTGQAEEEPVFDFAEDDIGLTMEDEPSGSVLVSEEGEPSADVLEVAEEVEDESSSDAVVPVRDDSEIESATISDSDVVTDILDSGGEESDDDLDTIDLDDVGSTGVEPPSADDLMTVIEEAGAGSSAETAPLGAMEEAEEAETVSLEEAEAVTAEVGEAMVAPPEIEEAPGAEMEEVAVEEEEAPAYAGYAGPAPMVDYVPSAPMNAVLILAILLGVFGGFMMLCEMAGAKANPVVTFVQEQIRNYFPNL